MDFADLIYRFDLFVGFLVSAIVFVLATKAYQETRKQSLLLIALASATGAISAVLPEMQDGGASWPFWYFETALRIVSNGLWLVGSWRLFREYTQLLAGTRIQKWASGDVGESP